MSLILHIRKVVELEPNIMDSHMEENILGKDYKILLSLGCGSFGEVVLACHLPTHARVAVKVLSKNTNEMDNIISEVELLQSLEHPNIVRFFHMIDTLTTAYMIMEYVEGEDLERCLRVLGCLKEEEARLIFQQVVSALHFLHQRHIAHRDIKLENILVNAAGNAKLCDFGMAIKITEGQMLDEFCGSLLYCAPEMLARKPYDGMAVDMWSLGIVLYVLVTGHFPYVKSTIEAMHKIITTTICPIPYDLSIPCYVIIAQLLMVPTWYRMTIHQLVEQPWVGHIQEHGTLATNEILPRVVNTMCNIGYTCEEIVSSLTHRQLKGEVMATFNILKYQLSCGDSHQLVKKPWTYRSPAGALIPSPCLKRRASEPAFSTCAKPWKTHFQDRGVEERGKNCRWYPMLTKYPCMERLPCSDDPVPEGDSLTADITNTATEDIAVNRNSMESLSDERSSPVSAQDETSTGVLIMGFYVEEPSPESDISGPVSAQDETSTSILNIDFYVEEPSPESDISSPLSAQDETSTGVLNMGFYVEEPSPESDISGPVSAQDETSTSVLNIGFYVEEPSPESDISSDQPKAEPTASRSRPLRGWKLMKKRISRALKALCCCCCMPSPWIPHLQYRHKSCDLNLTTQDTPAWVANLIDRVLFI